MKKIAILAILSVLFVAMSVSAAPKAHAVLTGQICILASGATSCGTPIPSLSDAVGTPLTVSVFIQGSDALGGAKVSIKSDPTVLNPTAISSVGTVVPAPGITLVDCINGVPVAGSGGSCQSGIDAVGVASLGILALGGSTVAPTTGLLFKVTYNVLSTTLTGIDILVNTGCAGGSVTGTNDCVLITNGAAVDPETVLVGTLGTDTNVMALAGIAPPPVTIAAPSTATGTPGSALTFAVTASDPLASDTVTLSSNFATGAPGSTFTTVGTNPVTGTFTWTPALSQLGTFTVTFSATDGHTTATASTTIAVSLAPVSFFGGKLSWTHHLSLAKNSNMQTWTAKLANPNSATVYAQVTIVGMDGTGTMGFTTISPVFTLTGGASITPTITQTFPTTDIGVKFHFTATIMWGTSPTMLTSPGGNTKSGAFAIVA